MLICLLLGLVERFPRSQCLLEVLTLRSVDDLLQLRLLTKLLRTQLRGEFGGALGLPEPLRLCGTLRFLGGEGGLQILLNRLVLHLLSGLALRKVLRNGAILRFLRLLPCLK